MKRILLLTTVSLIVLSCGGANSSSTEISETNFPFTETKSPTKTPIPPTSTFPVETQIPTSTTTPAPVIDAQGNITWRPQQVLIYSNDFGGDGVFYDSPPNFLLLWDGTLFQPNHPEVYVSHLDNKEVCKILNTIDSSGFFEEPNFDSFPFDGLWSSYFSVNSWKSDFSQFQALSSALSGKPFYSGLFCRDCPIPSADTIIKPGLANTYFFLQNYYFPNRQSAQLDKVRVDIEYIDQPATHSWPFKSITISDLFQKCRNDMPCNDHGVGLEFEGDTARELLEKNDGFQVYTSETPTGKVSFWLSLRPIWPFEGSEDSVWKEIPLDYTLTCNPKMGTYPILPLNPENQFWYYSPDGKWGAEVVNNASPHERIRIVSTFGYEKYYEYDPALFGQTAVKVYPRYWTDDGKYFFVNILPLLYYSRSTPFINSLGLQRISIDDGKVSYAFIGTEGQSFSYNLSEEYEQIAYIRQNDFPLKINLKDIHTLKEQTATLMLLNSSNLQYTEAGTMVWSVDGNFLFVAANYKADEKINTVVIKIDTSNPAIQSIIYQDDQALKLVPNYSLYEASFCPLKENIESNCSLDLDLETGTIE